MADDCGGAVSGDAMAVLTSMFPTLSAETIRATITKVCPRQRYPEPPGSPTPVYGAVSDR